MLIQPVRPGLGLRDPKTNQLIPENTPVEVPDNAIWRRRIEYGLCVLVPADRSPAPEPAPEPEPVVETVSRRKSKPRKPAKRRAKAE